MKITEKCKHCNDDYTPTRRGVQKFCSNSCRSRYWLLRQDRSDKELRIEKPEEPNYSNKELTKVKKQSAQKLEKLGMTVAGTGEAFVGAGVANVLTQLITNPASKSDVNELKSLIKGARYFPVKNMNPNQYGEYPYYDIETSNIVYLVMQN